MNPHNTAEKVLEGRLVSTVKFTEFRKWMMAEHPEYLTDDELVALYDEHVKHRDHGITMPGPGVIDTSPKSLRQILESAPPDVHPIAGEIGIDRNRSGDFLRVARTPDRSTRPPVPKRLSRAARKAARRARKRLRRHHA